MTKPRKKYFYDTEFHERGGKQNIDFISIGIVCEDGREYYAVSNEFDTRAVAANGWLMKNVMSSIKHEKFIVTDFEGMPFVRDIFITDPFAKTIPQIAVDIERFVAGTEPEWWNWYGAYDHVVLYQLWGTMMDKPDDFPMYSCDIKQLHRDKGFPSMPRQPAGLHNALADARFNVERYKHLAALNS